MGEFRYLKNRGIIESLKKDELGRLESGSAIWARLSRAPNGEALLTEDLVDVFEVLLLEGNTKDNAARVVGVSSKTLNKWLRQGVRDIEAEVGSLESSLVWVCERCIGEQERTLVLSAFRHALSAASDGTLALKILERRSAQDWAPALPATDTGPAKYVGMSASALRTEVRRVLQEAAKNDATPEAEVVPELKEG